MRGVYTKVKTRFYFFSALRVFFGVTDTFKAYLMMKLIDWVTNDTPDERNGQTEIARSAKRLEGATLRENFWPLSNP